MSEWISYKLGEVLAVKYGKDHKALNPGNIPCYGSGGIMRYVDSHLSEGPSILIPRKGSLSNILFAKSFFWTVDTMFWSKIRSNIVDPRFLHYQLSLIDWSSMNVGSAVPSLTVPVINDVEVRIPSKENQLAIAEVLSSIDDKIDLLNRQNETLEAMAQTLFRQWFIEEADDSWEEVELSFWITPKKGKILTKAKAIDGRVPVVAGGLEPACYHNTSNTLGPVITISASGANAGFVRLYFEEVWASDCSFIDLSVTKFIYFHYVHLKLNQAQLFDSQIGSAQPHVYPKHIASLVSRRYPIELIQEFEYLCEGWFSKVKSNMEQIKTLHQARYTILPKLMSGEVRVKLD